MINDNVLIISMTSYPKRIQYVYTVFESILSQNVDRDRYHCVLVLCKEEFPNLEKDLPRELMGLIDSEIELIWHNTNIRSHKKLIPAICKYPNNPILVIDDDVKRPNGWLDMFLNDHENHPNDIICGMSKTWLNEKLEWNDYDDHISSRCGHINSIPNMILSTGRPANGCGGTLYPANTFTDDRFFDEELFMKLSPTSDESWQFCFNIIERRNIRQSSIVYDYGRYILDGSQNMKECLWRVNNKSYGKIFKTLFDNFPEIKQELPNRLNHVDSERYCVASVLNDNFVEGFVVMLSSFLRHNKWFNGDVLILNSDNFSRLSDTSKSYINELFPNINIVYRRIDESSYYDLDFNSIPRKFIAPLIKLELFWENEYDKILYLDSDTIVIDNIIKMFNLPYDCVVFEHERNIIKSPTPLVPKYTINNGVFLINKKYISDENKGKILKLYNEYGRTCSWYRGCPDQDIMNRFLLSNDELQTILYKNEYNTIKRVFKGNKKHITNEKIIHYVESDKPWVKNRAEYSYINKLWFEEKKHITIKKQSIPNNVQVKKNLKEAKRVTRTDRPQSEHSRLMKVIYHH